VLGLVPTTARAHTLLGLVPATARAHTLLGLVPATARAHTLLGLVPATARAHTLLGLVPATARAHTHACHCYSVLAARAAPWELALSSLSAGQERLPLIAAPIAAGRLTDARSWMIAEPRVLSTLGAAEVSRQRLLRAIR
jgi:hypothetical protein